MLDHLVAVGHVAALDPLVGLLQDGLGLRLGRLAADGLLLRQQGGPAGDPLVVAQGGDRSGEGVRA